MTSYRSDHSPIIISLKLNEYKHGKGLWKFHNSRLKDIDYIQYVNNHIDQIKHQYAVAVYERESVSNKLVICNNKLKKDTDASLICFRSIKNS
jgi:hypothetical protein